MVDRRICAQITSSETSRIPRSPAHVLATDLRIELTEIVKINGSVISVHAELSPPGIKLRDQGIYAGHYRYSHLKSSCSHGTRFKPRALCSSNSIVMALEEAALALLFWNF